VGICKLTGRQGKFVKSHIIPRALTRPTKLGNKFIQPALSIDKRYIKRADSWYDKTIVIREGEDYLSDIDSHAIEELRALGLLWSSDKIRQPATKSISELAIVEFNDPTKIRIFFLSLLWRAAVSSLPEFKEIELTLNDIERLRKIIIREVDDQLSFFPVILIQLPIKGPTHNFASIKQQVQVGTNKREVYRFYMDGLIAHIHLSNPNLAILKNPVPCNHPMFVGNKQTIVIQVETEHSFQINNLEKLIIGY